MTLLTMQKVRLISLEKILVTVIIISKTVFIIYVATIKISPALKKMTIYCF